ncbi:glycosyltransferase [Desulfobacca acetoxidans]
MKNPRVAFVVTTFWNKPGLPAIIRQLAKGLSDRGYQIEIVSGKYTEPEYLVYGRSNGLRVIQIPRLRKQIAPWSDFVAFFDLYKLFRNRRYEIVHTFVPKAGILGRLAASAAGTPIIIHGVYGTKIAPTIPWPQRYIFHNLEWSAAKITDYFIFNSRELQKEYNRAGIGQQENSLVNYCGHDFTALHDARALTVEAVEAFRQQHHLTADDLILGYIARLVPAKGHIYAIRALKKLAAFFPNLKFLIIGEAWTEGERFFKKVLEREVEKLGLGSMIYFLGYVPQVEPYYRLFDIFVFPSLHEGLPIVLIEAKAMGLPVISFDIGGVREVLAEGDTLVPVGDVDGLAQALRNAIRKLDSDRSSRLARVQDLTPWEMRFSTAKMIDSIAHLYARLLGQSSH